MSHWQDLCSCDILLIKFCDKKNLKSSYLQIKSVKQYSTFVHSQGIETIVIWYQSSYKKHKNTKTMNYLILKCLLSYLWIASQCAVTFGGKSPPKKVGEFSAGSFILTQQSLHEAPYRYSGILRDVLDRVEARQPPSQSDEQNCDVRYRIEPSGETETKKLLSWQLWMNVIVDVLFQFRHLL